MNARIARKKLSISKHNKNNFLMMRSYTALNVKAARYLGLYDKIFWLYPFKAEPRNIRVNWSTVSETEIENSFGLEDTLVERAYIEAVKYEAE